MLKVYFVATDKSKVETEVISEIQPQNLLCSFFYFRNKPIEQYVEKIGYRPNIMLDSGAYSAWTTGKNISPIDYMNYIEKNKEYIEQYITLDAFADAELTMDYYKIMVKKGFEPIPVYHYGSDINYLEEYVKMGNEYIALGATVPIKDKEVVAKWVNKLIYKYPKTKFHLLGSSSKKITLYCDLESCDSSTWIMKAIMGKPEHIMGKGTDKKKQRAIYNMDRIIWESQYKQLEIGWCCQYKVG